MSASIQEEKLEQMVLETFEEITTLEDKINEMSAQQAEEESKLAYQFDLMKMPIYEKRDEKLGQIPDFWKNSFENHGLIDSLMSDMDRDFLNYIVTMKVLRPAESKSESNHRTYTIQLIIKADNPYIKSSSVEAKDNIAIQKTIVLDEEPSIENSLVELTDEGKKLMENSENFFSFFADDSEDCIELAQVLMMDLYPNILDYFQGIDEDDFEFDGEDDEEEGGN